MGVVYRAVDTKLGREVAIKLLSDAIAGDMAFLARFDREARTLAALNHPGIATIYGIEHRAIVMELVDGPTLEERMQAGAMNTDEALPIAAQIADALEAAHEKGVVHRDLKPANIKLTADGRVKVLDFGLAKAIDSAETPSATDSSPTQAAGFTRAGMILGTAPYMSPEQARGASVDRRTDIWAFGVVLFEMLSGRPLFRGDTVGDTLAEVLKAEIPWSALPASLPPHIVTLLRRCMDRDRKTRLRDIGEARIAIVAPAVTTISAPHQADRKRAPYKLPIAVLGGIALLSTGLYVREILRRPPPPEEVRFEIYPPEGARLSFSLSAPRISPDGRMIVARLSRAGVAQLGFGRCDPATGVHWMEQRILRRWHGLRTAAPSCLLLKAS
jgi:serine/threonine protein kinase